MKIEDELSAHRLSQQPRDVIERILASRRARLERLLDLPMAEFVAKREREMIEYAEYALELHDKTAKEE